MKKSIKYIFLAFLIMGILFYNSFVMAADDTEEYQGMTCIYGWSNYPLMLIQTPQGGFVLRQLSNPDVDINDIDSAYWANPLEAFQKEINPNKTKLYQNGKLTGCPACLKVVDNGWENGAAIGEEDQGKITLVDEDDCNLNYNYSGKSYHALLSPPSPIYHAPLAYQSVSGNIEIPENVTCNILLGNPSTKGSPAFYLVKAFEVIRYVAVILLVVLTVMDYVGAVASQDKDALSKVTSKAIKRLILCVAIFLLPMLIKFLLQFISDRQLDLCGVGG